MTSSSSSPFTTAPSTETAPVRSIHISRFSASCVRSSSFASQYSILTFLSRRDGMTQTALAADLELTKVAVGGLLERMEAGGFVERRDDEADARVRRVYLTRKGARTIQKVRELIDPIEAEMLAPIGDAELEHATRTLGQIKGALLDLTDCGVGSNDGSQRRPADCNALQE